MINLDITLLVTVVGLIVSVCSIAAFFLGRKKEASSEGRNTGILETDIKNISRQLQDMRVSFDRLSIKIETVDERRENEYRELFVQVTELKSSYKSLHKRLDAIEAKG